ncbi:hypothetical protein HIO71_04375 [Chryseobacterium aquaticum]|jgi:tetratricopeptide (TPR) repeat protein|uniref:Histidine kinase n=1 Tax=Chryseobacterium aquaticum TaxID=452084 RepID=A0A848N370_9FLAO|nr:MULTISPECIES: tetratricopeptide repeat-containing sensor histidine kinase [Chryseobacterium]KNB62102.1 hypothetical protein AC804_04225 [Chryseobacterium sp. Hurlbut01]NMR33442.1 hypothetical protein [Chryseobacterium aquaticum]NRQ45516.1 hypothetical protein [Chryseobacterium sp. C-204]
MKKSHSLFILLCFLIIIACNKQEDKIEADKLYEQGTELYYKKNFDSAFTKFYKSYQQYLNNKQNKDAAISLIFSSMIQTEKGDYLGSNDNATKAAKLLDKNDENFSSIYNQFGRNHEELKNYKEAIYFYNKAIPFSDNEHAKLVLQNNIGIINLKINNYPEAVKIFANATKHKLVKDSIDLGNKILDNYAYSKFLFNKNYNAEKELLSILSNKLGRKDLSGINASLSHLADFFKNKNQAKSLYYAKAMYENSKKTGSSDDELEALKKMISTEENGNIKPLFNKYQNLNDSIQKEINNSKSQFTSVIYDTEQNKINALNSENKVQKQYFLLVFLALVIIIISIWFRKRQIRLKQEKELEVKNTELRYSKKVHDKVANKVYHVMSEVENTENMNKEVLLYKLDGIYQISRDISYEKNDVALEHNFSQHLSQMLKSYSSENIKVPIIGNEESLWEDVGDHSKVEVFYILQELMTNMKKHSKADKVLIDFSRENDLINIVYSDNGIGISEFSPKNGVQNTESRINSIGGTINFDTKTENGLKITLSFPAKN